MSKALAKAAFSSFSSIPSYLQPNYKGLSSDLSLLQTIDVKQYAAELPGLNAAIVAQYGADPGVEQTKPFAYFDGNGVIPVHGVLLNRFSYSWSFSTGYNFILDKLSLMLADPDVKTIILDVNSPGGTCAGNKEVCDAVFAARSVKPILAIVDASCFSAAYAIASQASKIAITESGMCGSIGVVQCHVDESALNENLGLKITYLYRGSHKVDGNPDEPLTAQALEGMNRTLDYYYGLFTEAVARGRGFAVEDAEATEAECYVATDALDLKLVDSISTPSQALTDFYNETDPNNQPDDDEGTDQMAMTDAEKAAHATELTNLRAQMSTEQDTKIAAAVAAEGTRISSIMSCDEAKDRQGLARTLASTAGMSVDSAKIIMASAAKEIAPVAAAAVPATGTAALDKGMSGTPVILPGAGTDNTSGEKPRGEEFKSHIAARAAALKPSAVKH